MPSMVLVAPGPIEARTGGYVYDRQIVEGLRRQGWTADIVELDASFPYPTDAAMQEADRALAAMPTGSVVVVDSLALGAMPEIIIREASRCRLVALMHQPLAAAIGLDAATGARFEKGERGALRAVALVVLTGRAARPLIAKYGIAPDRVVVVEPGTDRAPLARGSRAQPLDVTSSSSRPRPLELLTVGTLNPGKGHEMLLTALEASREVPWRLTCAGSLTRDPATVDRVRATVASLGIADRVLLMGDLDRHALAAAYHSADLFVLATQQETYGMAVAEALAHGLPVVSTMTGAIPELVGEDAGVVVPVGNGPAFANALARVLRDDRLRATLAEGARRRRDQLPTWDETCTRMVAALSRIRESGFHA